jgi:SAM-dependent methyltransferase
MMNLNIGCGTDIRPGFINLDKVSLPGVDIVSDMTLFPYPFSNNAFSTILLINVLEHLPDTIKVMEELHRISQPGACLTIRVPYWNCILNATDPTHVRTFSEQTLDYFDPAKPLGKRRAYYSTARYTVKTVHVWLCIANRYFIIRNRYLTKFLLGIAHYISNVVFLIEYDLIALKSGTQSNA